MKRLTLVRRWYEDERTIGQLMLDGQHFLYAMEPGDADTQAPRVPTGFYHLVPHRSSRFGETWALVGRDVSHFEEPGVPRSAVLFHSGNRDHETRGCILLGVSMGSLEDEVAVTSSREAMTRLRGLLGASEAYLTITGG